MVLSGAVIFASVLAGSPRPVAAQALSEPPAASSPVPSPSATPTSSAVGSVPSDVTVELAGSVSRTFIMNHVQSAIAQAAHLAPGATMQIGAFSTPAYLSPGDVLDGQAAVTIFAGDRTPGPAGTTAVHIHVDTLAPFSPVRLLYSDDPEYVRADGLVYRSPVTIDRDHPTRAYLYHATTTADRHLYLVVQTTGTASRVQLLGSTVGPSTDYACVGHRATAGYLEERSRLESVVASPAGTTPYVIPLDARAMEPQELVNAIFDVRVLDGDPVTLSVISTTGGADPVALLATPPLPPDGHGRKGVFALGTVSPLALSYTAGADAEEPTFTIGLGAHEGIPEFPNLAEGAPLAGDYGILRPVSLTLANPLPSPQTVYLDELADSGAVTTTFWFDGDAAPTEISAASNPSQPYLVKAFLLAPNATRTVTGVYMTDGASWFPMEFSLTPSVPAIAPSNGCIPSGD